MLIEIASGGLKTFIALFHILFGILVLVFPNFLRFLIGIYFILVGILFFL